MKIRLETNKECHKCEGRGLTAHTDVSSTFAEVNVKIKICQCVKAVLSGKPSKRLLQAKAAEKLLIEEFDKIIDDSLPEGAQ